MTFGSPWERETNKRTCALCHRAPLPATKSGESFNIFSRSQEISPSQRPKFDWTKEVLTFSERVTKFFRTFLKFCIDSDVINMSSCGLQFPTSPIKPNILQPTLLNSSPASKAFSANMALLKPVQMVTAKVGFHCTVEPRYNDLTIYGTPLIKGLILRFLKWKNARKVKNLRSEGDLT